MAQAKTTGGKRYFGGCDVGSTYGKCVILDERGTICGHSTVRSKINPVATATEALDQAMAGIEGLDSAEQLAYLVGDGKPKEEIAAGLQVAIAKRCFVMAKKAGTDGRITLTGGCAKNAGLKKAIEHVLKIKVVELKTDPQLMGALGAAEYARQKGMAQVE